MGKNEIIGIYKVEYQKWLHNLCDEIDRQRLKAVMQLNASTLQHYWWLGNDILHDRMESDNRIEVTYLEGRAENNLSNTVRCKSTKPPYAERHVRWCGRSVNMKVGDKHL